MARLVDPFDQPAQGRSLGVRDIFQVTPEGIFKADARLVSTDNDGMFGD
jgi:hypothetical protein